MDYIVGLVRHQNSIKWEFKCKNSSKKSLQFSAAKFNFTPDLVSAICSTLTHKYLDTTTTRLAMNFLPKNYLCTYVLTYQLPQGPAGWAEANFSFGSK